MEVTNFTISKEELQQLIEDAVSTKPPALNLIWSTTSLPRKSCLERLGISKGDPPQIQKAGKDPF